MVKLKVEIYPNETPVWLAYILETYNQFDNISIIC